MPDSPTGQEDGDDLVGFGPGVAEHPDEIRGRRLGRGGQVPSLAEPAVEVLRLELDPIAKGLVAEHHLERDQRDVMAVQHRVGQVGGAVGHDGDGAPLRVREPAMLGPHVVRLGGLHPSPPWLHS